MDDSPRFTWIELDEIDSTNNFLRGYTPQQTLGLTLVTAEHQFAGRGQTGNTWESERGKNLLFSILHYPRSIEARTGFILSQAVALGVAEGVEEGVAASLGHACFSLHKDVCPSSSLCSTGLSIKWPNDIYVGDKKLCGILIETEIVGRRLQRMIAGVGININQQQFVGDAPNPVSLFQLLGHELERRFVLEQVIAHIQRRLAQAESDPEALRRDYMERLYRRDGYHWYEDEAGRFEATVDGIEPDGHLLLRDGDGTVRRYAFKEVKILLDNVVQ